MKSFFSDIPALFYPKPVKLDETVDLGEAESRHARSLRLQLGDKVQLLDGQGRRSFGIVKKAERASFLVRIDDSTFEGEESGLYIGLAVGLLSDKRRTEWLVEKSVELGAREIWALQSEHSEGFFNKERLHRVAIAALKQSQRVWLPTFNEPIDWQGLASVRASYDAAFLCHEQQSAEMHLIQALEEEDSAKRILILVGPEGGFSEHEVKQGKEEYEAKIVSLGSARLRAETAAITALVGIQFKMQD